MAKLKAFMRAFRFASLRQPCASNLDVHTNLYNIDLRFRRQTVFYVSLRLLSYMRVVFGP
jgi:hypothetical protein